MVNNFRGAIRKFGRNGKLPYCRPRLGSYSLFTPSLLRLPFYAQIICDEAPRSRRAERAAAAVGPIPRDRVAHRGSVAGRLSQSLPFEPCGPPSCSVRFPTIVVVSGYCNTVVACGFPRDSPKRCAVFRPKSNDRPRDPSSTVCRLVAEDSSGRTITRPETTVRC